MSCYNFITILLDTLYIQSRCTGRALVMKSVPGAHWGCAMNQYVNSFMAQKCAVVR